ncbi:MAG: hypothetical protein WD078_08820 [Woeseia sp.]
MNEPKVVPISRIAPATSTSREVAQRVIRELEKRGLIVPEWTATGRGYLSVQDWEQVRAALAR